MDKHEEGKGTRKSPALAAIISAIFPGTGFFYLGNFLKGVAYIAIFVLLIVLEVHSSEYESRVMEIVVFGLLLAGFYIYQIVESYNDANRMRRGDAEVGKADTPQISMFGSVVILLLGVIFQLERLDILELRDIVRLWPLLLIALGINIIFQYLKDKEGKKNG